MSENKTNINWYPGHMAKAKRLIKEALPNIDMVIELLDARAPISSTNPDFKNLFCGNPLLLCLPNARLPTLPKPKDSNRSSARADARLLRSTVKAATGSRI